MYLRRVINTCFSYRMTVKKCRFQYNIISNKHRSQRINAGIDTGAQESGAGSADALRRDFISDIKRGIYAYFAVFNGQKLSI